MMGSGTGAAGAASLKRKREPDNEETQVSVAGFLKSPTSSILKSVCFIYAWNQARIPNKVAKTHFRRQFLFQLLILLNHLLTFTKAAKESFATVGFYP